MRVALAIFLCGTAVWSSAPGVSASEPFTAQLLRVAPSPADDALAQIPDLGRKLLALRSYIRAGDKLTTRWSWTEAEIVAFQGSAEQEALLAEVAAVKAHFATLNPGYQLYANTKVRSLDIQIERWNENESVGVAAEEMLSAFRTAFGMNAQALADVDKAKLRNWLANFVGTKRANLAAPGLTLHGQAHAIDFQVMKDGKILAGADAKQIETVWHAKGWENKLKQSMDAAGPSFMGPLKNPDEPWHYNYLPITK